MEDVIKIEMIILNKKQNARHIIASFSSRRII